MIAIFGLSGVGKTRLASEAAAQLPESIHLQASSLIKDGLSDAPVSSEHLRLAGGDRILANQNILIEMFNRRTAGSDAIILFDGHLIIDADAQIIEIPYDVIAALRPSLLVHVEENPEIIAQRRRADHHRKRPERPAIILGQQQARSRQLCLSYGEALDVPVHFLSASASDKLIALCHRQ